VAPLQRRVTQPAISPCLLPVTAFLFVPISDMRLAARVFSAGENAAPRARGSGLCGREIVANLG
jgi:hypothetical protein